MGIGVELEPLTIFLIRFIREICGSSFFILPTKSLTFSDCAFRSGGTSVRLQVLATRIRRNNDTDKQYFDLRGDFGQCGTGDGSTQTKNLGGQAKVDRRRRFERAVDHAVRRVLAARMPIVGEYGRRLHTRLATLSPMARRAVDCRFNY